jgi:hypothetical protein
MLKCQYESNSKAVNIYPEIHFVQFILPCFVASFISLCKDTTVSAEGKKFYMRFVHELIHSFESEENLKDTSSTLIQKQRTPYDFFVEEPEMSQFVLGNNLAHICQALHLGVAGSECELVLEYSPVIFQLDNYLFDLMMDATRCEKNETKMIPDRCNMEFLYAQYVKYVCL